MGYSGRYHAASLAAVFVALAIGILIGIGLADDVVSSASEELENSLRSDLDDANNQIDDLEAQVERQNRFEELAGPALVANRLERERVAVVALGDLPDEETAREAQDAVEAAGGELAAVVVVDLPPDLAALRQAAGGRFTARAEAFTTEELGAEIGQQLVGGGPLIERIREQLFTRFNGSLEGIDRVVFVSQPPDELQADLSGEGRAFESSLIRAIDAAALGTVGVERSSTDPTTLPVFSGAGVSTVDNIDQVAGQVSVVFALLGAEGDFGIKEDATSLLPDLLPDDAQQAP
jgi:hypothetical protein